MSKQTSILFLSLLMLGFLRPMLAQQTLTIAEGSEFAVDGTSTLSDWTATTKTVAGSILLSEAFTKDGLPEAGAAVESAKLSIAVNTLDGGRGDIMNGKILRAFDEPNHPEISFEMTSGMVRQVTDPAKHQFAMVVKGTLSLAGTKQDISLPLTGEKHSDGTYLFTGEYVTNMTVFEIDPPTALYGQIESGDEIKIRFTLQAKPE